MYNIRLAILSIISILFLIFPKSYGQWTQSIGLENASVTGFSSIDNNLLAGVEGGYIYLSQDSGATWIPIDTIASVQFCPNCGIVWIPTITLYTNGKNVFAGSSADSGSVHLSTDGGLTWKENDPGFVENINCFSSIGGIIYAGTNNGVYLSADNGKSWKASNNGLTSGNYDSVYSHAPQVWSLLNKGSDLFAGTFGEGIFFSSDSGASWSKIDSGLTDLNITCLAAIDTDIYAGAFLYPIDSTGGVYISGNNGTSWHATNSGLTNKMVNVLYADDSLLFAGTNGNIFASADKGRSWKVILTRPSASFALTVFGSYLITNGNGVWRYPLSQLVTNVADRLDKTPDNFKLEQNYPNPFNPATIITYSLPAASDVTLRVYDILGREIKTLVDEHQNAGIQSVTFNAAGLPSGTYFYRLTAGSFTETKKLILMK